jgi:hypothetical protein
VVARWNSVTETTTGDPVKIIAYQLIVEKDVAPHPHWWCLGRSPATRRLRGPSRVRLRHATTE